eukprot:SAG11_NODE_34291_length_272_cov_4.439306_1_plen_25_part_10
MAVGGLASFDGPSTVLFCVYRTQNV